MDKKGDFAGYWTTDKTFQTSFFNQTMSRNRYQITSRFLHCVDNNKKAANCTDNLYKIQTLYDLLTQIWKDMYNPGEHISIDEGMLKWRGRLSFRVYNKNKPIKYGIRSYILCDSANAYSWALDIYASEGMKLEETIRRLLDTCLHKWHSLYMDNFYN